MKKKKKKTTYKNAKYGDISKQSVESILCEIK